MPGIRQGKCHSDRPFAHPTKLVMIFANGLSWILVLLPCNFLPQAQNRMLRCSEHLPITSPHLGAVGPEVLQESPQCMFWLTISCRDTDHCCACRLAEDTEGEQEANTRENAAEVLAAVARSRGSPLTAHLAAPDFLEQLLQHAFGAQQGSTLVQVWPAILPEFVAFYNKPCHHLFSILNRWQK